MHPSVGGFVTTSIFNHDARLVNFKTVFTLYHIAVLLIMHLLASQPLKTTNQLKFSRKSND